MHSLKLGLSLTQDLKKKKKNPEHPFVDTVKSETGAKYQQIILNSVVVGAYYSFQIFKQITWFLVNSRVISNIKYWVLHYLVKIKNK